MPPIQPRCSCCGQPLSRETGFRDHLGSGRSFCLGHDDLGHLGIAVETCFTSVPAWMRKLREVAA